jgi:hypothetical protein
MPSRTHELEHKGDIIRLRIPPELKAKAERRAARQGMGLSKYLRTLIEEDLAPPVTAETLRRLRQTYEVINIRGKVSPADVRKFRAASDRR